MLYSRCHITRANERGGIFVKEQERAGHMISAQMDKVALNLSSTKIATKDALENIKLNTMNMIWDTGESGLKNESQLRAQMNGIFSMLMESEETNAQKFLMLEEHVNATGVGTLNGMQYSTFNDLMKGKQHLALCIRGNVLTAFQSFISRYANYDVM